MSTRHDQQVTGDTPSRDTQSGALVISLDFELHWGVADIYPPDGGMYRANLLGARSAVPAILELFEEFEIAATWATVGFLMAVDRNQLRSFQPRVLPAYADARLSPYGIPVGNDEHVDPLHFAPSLVQRIRQSPRQQIATHTFSHFYCLEPGQTREAFAADIDSALTIAAEAGIQIQSIVFPRNQFNPEYSNVLIERGLGVYRGNPPAWLYRAGAASQSGAALQRIARMADTYLPLSGSNTVSWDSTSDHLPFVNVAASRFLRPCSPALRLAEPLRRRRITSGITRAAREHRLYHLWWHPHNFGVELGENIRFLRKILEHYRTCHVQYGMRSLSMEEVANEVRHGR